VIIDITEYIVDWILDWPALTGNCIITEDPGIEYNEGLYLAYKNPDKGILIKTSEESEYSGVDDRRGNFFYLRHVDDEELIYNPIEQRVSGCSQGTQVVVSLRLVSVLRDVVQINGNERYEVEEFLRNALLNLSFTDYIGIETNIDIELTLSKVNSPQILKDERVNDTARRGFGLSNIFTAIDFTLKFNFNNEKKN